MLNWLRRAPAAFSEDETAEIKTLCASVAEHLRLLGHPAEPFSQAPHQRPKNIHQRLAWLRAYNEILEMQAVDGKREKDLMWKFFAKLRYIPTSDIFDRIEDGHYVEIYDLQGDQIYRSLNYFDMVSFSVEDVLNLNWKRHYKRSSRIKLSLLGLSARLFTGQFHETYDCAKIPTHRVSETIAGRYLFELKIRYFSPLKQNGKCLAIVVVSNVRRLKPA